MALIDKIKQDLDKYLTDYALTQGELTQEVMDELGAQYIKQNRTRYLSNSLIIRWWKWYLTDQQVPQGLSFLTTKQMRKNDKDVLIVDGTIPHDNAVLINVDKWISLGLLTPCNELERIAHERIDSLTSMNISIDGVEHTPIRIDSGSCFIIQLKHDLNDMELGPSVKKGKYKAFTDGYWLLLGSDELSTGKHVIYSTASCRTGTLSLSVEYHLNKL